MYNKNKLYSKAYDAIRSKAQQLVGSQKLYRELTDDTKSDLRDAGKKLLLLSDLDNPLKQYNDSRAKHSSGYVYLVTNAAWPEWVKIGRAINTKSRLLAYQTSSPLRDYEVACKAKVANTQSMEAALLSKIKEFSSDSKGEWLQVDIKLAKHLFNIIVVQ